MTDATVDAARRGSKPAIACLVRAHWRQAFRTAYLIIGDRHAAEDATQEAMISAVEALASFDPVRPFGPWIDRIAANKAHDWIRSQARRPEVVVAEPPEPRRGEQDIADQIADAAVSEELVAGLFRLAPELREAVVLRHLLDLPPSEVSEIVGVPASTVRTRTHRGLSQLRHYLIPRKEVADESTG